jgi:endo-1,4-beta-xylanase
MHKNKLTRRDFLKLAGTTSAGLALSACGVRATELPTIIPTFMPTPSLTATTTPIPTNTSTLTPKPPESLRDFAEVLDIKIGTLIDGTARFWENIKWQEVAKREFNLGVITPLWHVVIPKKDTFDFSWPDLQIGFAQSADMAVHIESLVMSLFTPQWLKEGKFTREQLLDMYQKYCRRVVQHYKGRVNSWSGVIEAGFVPPYDTNDFWFRSLGKDYVDMACAIIREEEPSIPIIYGDSENFVRTGAKYQHTKNLIQYLKEKKLVDGVGIEIDWDAAKTPPSKDELVATMQSYGVPVYITEIVVNLRNVGGPDEERFQRQAEVYRLIIEAALESRLCKQLTFWGFGDKYSFAEQKEFQGSPKADATLFDDNLEPKPAYFAVLDVLRKMYNEKQ